MKMLGYCDVCQWILLGPMLQEIKCIGIGRFRILGGGGGGGGEPRFRIWGGGPRGCQIPSRHMLRNDVDAT